MRPRRAAPFTPPRGRSGDHLDGPDRRVTYGAIVAKLKGILPVAPRRAPEVLRAIAGLLAESASEGEDLAEVLRPRAAA